MKPATLLIVDDDQANRALLQRSFQGKYRVIATESGTQALEALANYSIDVVLLDIMMPDINGLEVLKLIRESAALRELPVILLTALADVSDVVEGLRLGANDYITKPINIDIVEARVETQVKLKRLMDKRNQTIHELLTLQNMRMKLFRVATHDLKSPLTNIRVAEYMLRQHVNGNAQATHLLDTIKMTVLSMEGVINNFLDAAIIENGKLELELICQRLSPILWDVVKQYTPQAVAKNIQLQIEDFEATVWADGARLGQIIGNLLSNAIKYSPQNSTVRIWGEQTGEQVRLFIADQGPGIPAHERQMLFTEFGKLSTEPTAGESSTGLGLWIAKHLISLHRGDIGVHCPPEGGSVFWIELEACALNEN